MKKIIFCLIILCSLCARLQAQTPFLQTPIEGIYNQDFYIVNYVDWSVDTFHDHFCDSKSYDGHEGTDFVLKGFPEIDKNIKILAAADGVVTAIRDGLFDRNKHGTPADGFGNYVCIKLANKYYSYYAHCKIGLPVHVGDTVKAGQAIGYVASSGYATDPHLHFELWYDSLYVVDPFAGPCGNGKSLWLNPLPFDTLFRVIDRGFVPFIPSLDTLRDRIGNKYSFNQKDNYVFFWSLLHGIRKNETISVKWYTPLGELWFQNDYTVPYDGWYIYYGTWINRPALDLPGNWYAELYYKGILRDSANFTVDLETSVPFSESNSADLYYAKGAIFVKDYIVESADLFDLTGRIVFQHQTPVEQMLYVSENISNGVYILQWRDHENKIQRKKIFISHF